MRVPFPEMRRTQGRRNAGCTGYRDCARQQPGHLRVRPGSQSGFRVLGTVMIVVGLVLLFVSIPGWMWALLGLILIVLGFLLLCA